MVISSVCPLLRIRLLKRQMTPISYTVHMCGGEKEGIGMEFDDLNL